MIETLKKHPGVRSVSTIIALLFISYEVLDWGRLFFDRSPLLDRYVDFSKLAVSLLCTVLVLLGKGFCFNKKDRQRLLIAFAAINLGDLAFSLNWISSLFSSIGIVVFLIAQILMVVRLEKVFASIDFSLPQNKRYSIITGIFILLIGSSLVVQFGSLKSESVPFVLILIYGCIISASVWAAMQVQIGNVYPETNKSLIMFGMIFFYLGDAAVGFMLVITSQVTYMIVTSLVWMFYTPALVLLALSSYNYGPASPPRNFHKLFP